MSQPRTRSQASHGPDLVKQANGPEQQEILQTEGSGQITNEIGDLEITTSPES